MPAPMFPALITLVLLLITACTIPSSGGQEGTDSLVLATPQPLGAYNPIDGYGASGVSPLYDGLLRPDSASDERLPDLVPALAAQPPSSNPDQTVWDVELRPDVTFSDGTTLTAADVVATYQAVLDPESASGVAAHYAPIESVAEVDDHHVRFRLRHPYMAFSTLLLLGIAPAEQLTGGPVQDSPLNRQPVGTGPYILTELSAGEAVFQAREDYWGGTPEVKRLIVVHLPDDNARAQRMMASEIDGTVLPPALAESFHDVDHRTVVPVMTADWRGVSLPADDPLTGDENVRMAMNLGVDRQALVDHVLAGHGHPAHTPAATVHGDGFSPTATFDHDPERAKALLTQAGWTPGADGVRTRDGQRAELTVLYEASDTIRRDLAVAFAGEMANLGIDIKVQGATWAEMDKRVTQDGILLGGGDQPYDLDPQLYEVLHTRSAATSIYNNPAGFRIPGVDALLEEARRSADPDQRAAAYRSVQDAYVQHPTHVFLAFVDHTYVMADEGWHTGPLVVEPHAHGVDWGPWWNLQQWTR